MYDDAREALSYLFNEYLRPYQRELLLDFSRRRIVNKGRRVGVSHALALDCVLTSSGLWEAIEAPVLCANYNVISKRDDDAQDFIGFCLEWIEVLAAVESLQPWVALERSNTTMLKFIRSRKRIKSDTQSELAGRGPGGHILKDESAWYRFAREIVAGADKVPLSDRRLRLTEASTPNGTSGMGEVHYMKWSDMEKYGDYSRHEIDIHRAIEDGFPITLAEARADCFSEEEFQQEFCCKFLGSADEYFTRDLIQASISSPPSGKADMTIVGIDVASVVDLTAVVVMRKYGAAIWIEDVFLVRGVPYASGLELGQEHIVAGLLWAIAPAAAIIDCSADGAELYGRLVAQGVGKLAPHSFHSNGRQWKEHWVPRVRAALEDSSLRIAPERPRVYQRGAAAIGSVSKQSAKAFVDTAFRTHHFDALQHDFMRIRRKLLASGVTFDSPRDAEGHGDSFWAAAMAYSLVGDLGHSAQQSSTFSKLLDVGTQPSAETAYGDYF